MTTNKKAVGKKPYSDSYWADYVHLEGGKMIPVIEGFDTLQEAVEFVETAKKMNLKYRKVANV